MTKDFRLDADYPDHPKTKKLIRACGEGAVLCHIRLLGFVTKYKWTGELTNMTAEDIEIAAGWTGEPGAFLAALVAVKFLDEAEGRYSVHDWEHHNAFAATFGERREQAKKAVNARWEKRKNTQTENQYYSNDDSVFPTLDLAGRPVPPKTY